MNQIVHIFLVGWAVLLVAIIVNIVASHIGLLTWYTHLKQPSGTQVIDILFLYVLYPLILGLVASGILALLR